LKQKLTHLFIKYSPESLLEFLKRVKQLRRRRYLESEKKNNRFITEQQIEEDLKNLGLSSGDSVLVHASMSKIGMLKDGPKTLINAIENVISKEGTLLIPTFPAPGRNYDYLKTNSVFDVVKTPSMMGKATEYFRTLPNVKRSLHPTDCVSVRGPLAEYFTSTHFNQLTPYNEQSPFRKLCKKNGKILMIGTTLNGACTNLHTLEDAVEFPYPVYADEIFEIEIINSAKEKLIVKTKVHNPVYSAKRNADALLPIFIREDVLQTGKIGEAKSMIIDADKMLQVMIKYFKEYGVSMYTPYGIKNQLK
jgi:aminoglycoside 3-N-acetyltransferase